MAALEDKGIKYSSPLLLVSMNPELPNVDKRSHEPGAYYERLFSHYFEVTPKPEYAITTPKGKKKLDHMKLPITQGILHPDKYLNFRRYEYDGSRSRIDRGLVKFSEIIREIVKDLKYQEMVAERMDSTLQLPPLDVTEMALDPYFDESDEIKPSIHYLTIADISYIITSQVLINLRVNIEDR